MSSVCLHPSLLLSNQTLLALGVGQAVHRLGNVVPICTILLIAHLVMMCCYFWGLNCLGPLGGGLLPALVEHFLHWVSSLYVWLVLGCYFCLGEIGHDLATNKFVEVRTVLGHGVASLVGEMADVAVAEALDSRDAGCCSIRGLLQMGISGPSSPRDFRLEELGISWIFALGTLYIVNSIGVGLAVGHFVDVAVGFVIKVCMAVAVVAIVLVLW